MRAILFIGFFVSMVFGTKAYNTAELFDEDLEQIELQFAELDLIVFEIIESGELDSPLSSSFKLPLDSLNQDFPIWGIPTFWLVFFPTCAANCLIPCTGSVFGASSVFYINYFSKNDNELTREALAGCIAGHAPILIYLAWIIVLST